MLTKKDSLNLSENIAFINTYSGKLNTEHYAATLFNALLLSEKNFRLHSSLYKGHIAYLLADYACNLQNVLIAGGDGTLNEALQYLLYAFEEGRQIPNVFYLPSGTTCDFANNIGMTTDYVQLMEKFNQNKLTLRNLDMGIFQSSEKFPLPSYFKKNKRYFSYVAACGALTQVAYETTIESKQKLGSIAYFLNGLKEIPFLDSFKVKITVDDQEIIENVLFLAISNSFSIAGMIKLDRDLVSLEDGYLELLILKDAAYSILRPASLVSLALDLTASEQVSIVKGKNIKLEFEKKVPWTLDGEFAGFHKNIQVDILPNSLKIYTSSKEAR